MKKNIYLMIFVFELLLSLYSNTSQSMYSSNKPTTIETLYLTIIDSPIYKENLNHKKLIKTISAELTTQHVSEIAFTFDIPARDREKIAGSGNELFTWFFEKWPHFSFSQLGEILEHGCSRRDLIHKIIKWQKENSVTTNNPLSNIPVAYANAAAAALPPYPQHDDPPPAYALQDTLRRTENNASAQPYVKCIPDQRNSPVEN